MKKGKLTDRAAEFIVSLVDEELAALKVKTIADALGVNPSYLSRKFRNDKDMTLNEFITGEKMRRSALLLATSKEVSIVNLAKRTGYARSDYFVILFRNHYGIHPREFVESKFRKRRFQPRDYN
jgi:two-component system response regulator YesN